MLIVLANATVAQYPHGGGHWTWFLQYPLGLLDLGHDVYWIEIMRSTKDRGRDVARISSFLKRTAEYGLEGRVSVVLASDTPLGSLDEVETYGSSNERLIALTREADLLWNFWFGLKAPLLDRFRHRAFIDVDPGHLQVCAASFPTFAVGEHDSYLTVGLKIHDLDCEIPTLGHRWHTFKPFVDLRAFEASPDPGTDSPFTSITHWNWEHLEYHNRVLSISKRAAYFRYVSLPNHVCRCFELAADLPSEDANNFISNGWEIVNPVQVAGSPELYCKYIRGSRAEFMCPKPIHIDLKTGWFSDRSVVYLASGRPVLAEDTGFSQKLPNGIGLVAFKDLEGAAAAVEEIDRNYAKHQRAARDLADEIFDSRKCLREMLGACGA